MIFKINFIIPLLSLIKILVIEIYAEPQIHRQFTGNLEMVARRAPNDAEHQTMSSPESIRAMPPHALGEDIDVPFIS